MKIKPVKLILAFLGIAFFTIPCAVSQENQMQNKITDTTSAPKKKHISDDDIVFIIAEQPATFPGGDEAKAKFIKENMQYPEDAKEQRIEGVVLLDFRVGKDGSISDIEVLRGVSETIDAEAVRLVSIMPNWNPAKQRGHLVFSKAHLSIKFVLEKEKKNESKKNK